MNIQKLNLTDFRNFAQAKFDLDPNLTLVLGPNASGKSTLLEAAYFLAAGVSPKTRLGREAIKWDKDQAVVRGLVKNKKGVVQNLSVVVYKTGKEYFVGGKEKALADFWGHLQAVLFSPSDLVLIEGSPRRRRRFLNQNLFNLKSNYLAALGEYRRGLKQRNQLLRSGAFSKDQFDVWEENLSRLGAYILAERLGLVRELNRALREKESGLIIRYLPSPRRVLVLLDKEGDFSPQDFAGILREKLYQLREKERVVGFTLVGPQRDDFEVWQDSINLGKFGSRGQQRLAVLSLKVAQLDLVCQKIGEPPVFLLDDIFSELDKENQKKLEKLVYQQQTLLTSTSLDKIPNQLRRACTIRLPISPKA